MLTHVNFNRPKQTCCVIMQSDIFYKNYYAQNKHTVIFVIFINETVIHVSTVSFMLDFQLISKRVTAV